MTDELLTPAEETQAEGAIAPAESAPAPEEKKEPKLSPEAQKAIDQRIGKEVAKRYQLERELNELKSKVQSQPKPLESVPIPSVPDPLSVSTEAYNKALAEREEAIRRAGAVDEQNKRILEQQRAAEQALLQRQQEEAQKKFDTYHDRARKNGFDDAKLKSIYEGINPIGVSNEVAEFILEDDDGPFLAQYLSENQMELASLRSMPTHKAVARVATFVKAQAAALKPKPTSAPDPVDLPTSGSHYATQSKLLKGATFE